LTEFIDDYFTDEFLVVSISYSNYDKFLPMNVY